MAGTDERFDTAAESAQKYEVVLGSLPDQTFCVGPIRKKREVR